MDDSHHPPYSKSEYWDQDSFLERGGVYDVQMCKASLDKEMQW